jgi:hypothetical protein
MVTVSFAKLVYSAGLVLAICLVLYLAFVFGREFRRVWTDRSTYLLEFSYDHVGETKPLTGRWLTNGFRTALADLDGIFVNSATGLPPGAQAYVLHQKFGFSVERSPVEELNLTWQGLDVSGILGRLRKWAWKPETLTARVTKTSSGVDALLEWTNPPKPPESSKIQMERFLSVRDRASERRAVFDLACRVFWLNANTINNKFEEIDPDAFCEWAALNEEFRALDHRKRKTAAGLTLPDKARVQSLRDEASRLVDLDPDFVMAVQLRRQIIALIPDSEKSSSDFALTSQDQSKETGALQQLIAGAGSATDRWSSPNEISTKVLQDAQQQGVIAPGIPLVGGGLSTPFITAGPIVQNSGGERFIVLPDYAVTVARSSSQAGKAPTIEIGIPAGPVIGDLTVHTPDASSDHPNIVLVKLRGGVAASNSITTAAGESIKLRPPKMPVAGTKVRGAHSGFFTPEQPKLAEGLVAEVDPAGKFVVEPDIGAPGTGGAPIIDETGALIGIVYAGIQSANTTSPILSQSLQKLGLELVPD